MFFSKKKKKRKKDCRQGQGLGAVVGARHGVVETVDGSVEPRAGQRRERCRGGREREPGGGKEADGDGVAPWSRSIPIPIHVCVRAALCRLFSFFYFRQKVEANRAPCCPVFFLSERKDGRDGAGGRAFASMRFFRPMIFRVGARWPIEPRFFVAPQKWCVGAWLCVHAQPVGAKKRGPAIWSANLFESAVVSQSTRTHWATRKDEKEATPTGKGATIQKKAIVAATHKHRPAVRPRITFFFFPDQKQKKERDERHYAIYINVHMLYRNRRDGKLGDWSKGQTSARLTKHSAVATADRRARATQAIYKKIQEYKQTIYKRKKKRVRRGR